MNLQTLQPGDLVQLMQGRPARLAILGINLLLVIWIAWMLANLTLSLLDSGEAVVDAVPETPPPVAGRQDEYRALVKQIPAWRLMGEAKVEVAEPVKPAAPLNAPETRLKLILRGAFASDAPELARAIIADQRGKEEMYAVGDKVPGNAELSEIRTDHVILVRSGRYETLSLPEERRGGAASQPSSARRNPAGGPGQLQSIRKALKQNPKSLYALVRPSPKRDEDGNMIGYTLQPGRDPELFQDMGLQPGDVVTHVNEVELSDLSSGMRALKSAQAGQSVTLTVMRGGQEEKLSISVPE